MNVSTLKSKLGIANSSSDQLLTDYLAFINTYLENLFEVDFSKFGQTATKKFSQAYSLQKFMPIEAWSAITSIKYAEKSTSLTWSTLTEYQEIEKVKSKNIKNTFRELKAINGFNFDNKLVEITGTYGFHSTNLEDWPLDIQSVIVEGARTLINHNKSKGNQIQREKSGNLEITYSDSVENVLAGLGWLNPESNKHLAAILNLYKPIQYLYL